MQQEKDFSKLTKAQIPVLLKDALHEAQRIHRFVSEAQVADFASFAAIAGALSSSVQLLFDHSDIAAFGRAFQDVSGNVDEMVRQVRAISGEIEDVILQRHFSLIASAIEFQLQKLKISGLLFVHFLRTPDSDSDAVFGLAPPSVAFPHSLSYLLQLVAALFHTLYPIFSAPPE
ncbi:MAG: hypothetical protein Q8P67_01215 [archaeon]|nr:hypothetical protein [archaeon]